VTGVELPDVDVFPTAYKNKSKYETYEIEERREKVVPVRSSILFLVL